MNIEKRVNWSEYALHLARCAALRSEDPYRKVGACALSYDNRVLGVAYNGLQSGKSVDDSFWVNRDERRNFVIHAETNLLSLFKRNECKILACTLLPCENCAKMIAAWNIPDVIYSEDYDLAPKSIEIFRFYNIKVTKLPI